jgi:hypothetical protein
MARKRKEISEAQRRRIIAAYKEGLGMLKIGNSLGHNVVVIRRVLIENNLVVRGRGRPRKLNNA